VLRTRSQHPYVVQFEVRWRWCVVGIAESELTFFALAPTGYMTVRANNGAGVSASSSQREYRFHLGHLDGFSNVVGRIVTELTRSAAPPTLCLSRLQACTTVLSTCRDAGDVVAIEASHLDSGALIRTVAVA